MGGPCRRTALFRNQCEGPKEVKSKITNDTLAEYIRQYIAGGIERLKLNLHKGKSNELQPYQESLKEIFMANLNFQSFGQRPLHFPANDNYTYRLNSRYSALISKGEMGASYGSTGKEIMDGTSQVRNDWSGGDEGEHDPQNGLEIHSFGGASLVPGKEVFFPQLHQPGKRLSIEFTHMDALEVTSGGEPFPHLLFHAVLTYSNWQLSLTRRRQPPAVRRIPTSF